MLLIKIFPIFFIFVAGSNANPANDLANGDPDSQLGWYQCINAVSVSPVAKPYNISDDYHEVATCLPDMGGGTNWKGVMSAITSLIPGAEFISALTSLMDSVSFSGSYSSDLNDCISLMIHEALEEDDLDKCAGRMVQIQDAKTEFKWAIDQDLNNKLYFDLANEKIAKIDDLFSLIQNDFAQKGNHEISDRHHEKFLDFVFDSMATLGTLRVKIVDALEKQQLPLIDICTTAAISTYEMKSTYHQHFDYDGEWSLQRTLDESDFNQWETRIWYKEIVIPSSGSQTYGVTVHDDYRGEQNGDDSFTCTECLHTQSLFFQDGDCEIESNGEKLPEFDNWIMNPKVECDHCMKYVANQKQVRRQQIEDAAGNYQKLIDSVEEIESRLNCVSVIDDWMN